MIWPSQDFRARLPLTPSEAAFAVSKRDILQSSRLYAETSEPLRSEIQRNATVVHLRPGEHLFEQGRPCKQFAILGSGRLRVYIAGQRGREISLYQVTPGETCSINLLCALLGSNTLATSEAESEVKAVVCSTATLQRWIDQSEAMRRFVFEEIRARFVAVTTLLQSVAFGTLKRRLAQFLLDRFAISSAQPPRLACTHERLANELATAREVVSRLLKEFERLGVVELQRARILLRNEAALRLLASKGAVR